MAILRTITLGIGDSHPLDGRTIAKAAEVLRQARERAEDAGHAVQTVRIATRPLLDDMADAPAREVEMYAQTLQGYLTDQGIDYCSIGPAPAYDPAFALDRTAVLGPILSANPSLSATVQLAYGDQPATVAGALAAAEVIRALADVGDGEDNFRFAALAMCEPGGPFFPQAYVRDREWRLSVGLQSASVVREAIERLPEPEVAGIVPLRDITEAVSRRLRDEAAPVVALIQGFAESAGFGFGGIDLSPAPMGDDSIVAAFEASGVTPFGAPGTLAVASALTGAIRSIDLPTCGYCGLMLPVLEDALLGMRCAEEAVSVTSLLAYSAVCGTGLDTIPLAGDTSPERIAALLLDVASLAFRLRKPLSARLFLVPGASAGDLTSFASPYLTNTRVLDLGS